MTYESTGEVRRPFKGEWYYCPTCQKVELCIFPGVCSEGVIMRPVEEKKQTETCQCVVIPFFANSYTDAKECLEEIETKLHWCGLVKQLELTENELNARNSRRKTTRR